MPSHLSPKKWVLSCLLSKFISLPWVGPKGVKLITHAKRGSALKRGHHVKWEICSDSVRLDSLIWKPKERGRVDLYQGVWQERGSPEPIVASRYLYAQAQIPLFGDYKHHIHTSSCPLTGLSTSTVHFHLTDNRASYLNSPLSVKLLTTLDPNQDLPHD